MESRFLVVANWKANKTILEAIDWVKKFEKIDGTWTEEFLEAHQKIEVVIAAPYMLLSTLDTHLARAGLHEDSGCLNPVGIASQDISTFPKGAYTGEMPGEILENLVTYCLVGHSERRKYLGENTGMIAKKIDQAVKNDIIPIICAQTLEEIPTNIRDLSGDKFAVMYEPEEAISTEGEYHPESPDRVEMTLSEWKSKLNLSCRLLYGGSVNSQDAETFSKLPVVSGFVVGHASLQAEEFFSIIKAVSKRD